VTADRELSRVLAAHTAEQLGVEGLAATAAVGVPSLTPMGHATVLHEARAGIGQLAGQRVEPGLGIRNEGQIADDRLRYPDPDLGLLEAALSHRRHGAREISRGREGLVLETARQRGAQRNTMILIGVADVDRSIQGNAAQRQAVGYRVRLGGCPRQRQTDHCSRQVTRYFHCSSLRKENSQAAPAQCADVDRQTVVAAR